MFTVTFISTLGGIPIGFSDDVTVYFAHTYKQGSTLGGLGDIDDSHIITCKCAVFTFSEKLSVISGKFSNFGADILAFPVLENMPLCGKMTCL